MTLEELTETLVRCNLLAEFRERLKTKQVSLEQQIEDVHDRRIKDSREITKQLSAIEPILRRLPENECLLVGEWVYWEGDDGPCLAKIRRVYDLAGVLAEIGSEAEAEENTCVRNLDLCEFDACFEYAVKDHPSGLCQGHLNEHVALIATLGDDALVDAIERADRAYPDADSDLKASAQEWCPTCHKPIEAPGRIHLDACHCGVCWKSGCNERVKPGYNYCAVHAFVVPTGGES